jgi:Protein of unknown function (DUF3667)
LDKSAPRSDCGNCGAALMGPYCSNCGQHAHESARSISALFHDAWHLLSHVDGRLWQSLYLLLLRPGRLTQEYFAERRVRYLPPVRLYLVMSVLIFAFVFVLSPDSDDRSSGLPSDGKTSAAQSAQGSETGAAGDQAEKIGKTDLLRKKRGGFTLDTSDCAKSYSSLKWLDKPLRRACMRQVSTGGQAVTSAFLRNIPKMMFVFVPMIALVMLILYWRPPRYYVEHLVFFLHIHAAVFLILLLEALVGWMVASLGWRTFGEWVILFTTLYSVWYVYRAMRVYYAQGRWLTLGKFIFVGFAYTVGLGATLVVTGLVSALIA